MVVALGGPPEVPMSSCHMFFFQCSVWMKFLENRRMTSVVEEQSLQCENSVVGLGSWLLNVTPNIKLPGNSLIKER